MRTSDPLTDEPECNCRLCPRLAAFRDKQVAANPDWHNGPVPIFGRPDGRLVIVGLAPGLKGANRTGRPFTGDYAGDLLFSTLGKFGFSSGSYEARPDDGLQLVDCKIVNAVRCVPPENKPELSEIRTCNRYLAPAIIHLSGKRAILALGTIAHDAVLMAFGERRTRHPFGHGKRHRLAENLYLFDSYHCSRYNTNTGRLTGEMFESVFTAIRAHLNG